MRFPVLLLKSSKITNWLDPRAETCYRCFRTARERAKTDEKNSCTLVLLLACLGLITPSLLADQQLPLYSNSCSKLNFDATLYARWKNATCDRNAFTTAEGSCIGQGTLMTTPDCNISCCCWENISPQLFIYTSNDCVNIIGDIWIDVFDCD